jgi:hypothetical protein
MGRSLVDDMLHIVSSWLSAWTGELASEHQYQKHVDQPTRSIAELYSMGQSSDLTSVTDLKFKEMNLDPHEGQVTSDDSRRRAHEPSADFLALLNIDIRPSHT